MLNTLSKLWLMISTILVGFEKYASAFAKGGEWAEAQMSLFAEEAEHGRAVKRLELQQKIDELKQKQKQKQHP